jgi:hypothetical protein
MIGRHSPLRQQPVLRQDEQAAHVDPSPRPGQDLHPALRATRRGQELRRATAGCLGIAASRWPRRRQACTGLWVLSLELDLDGGFRARVRQMRGSDRDLRVPRPRRSPGVSSVPCPVVRSRDRGSDPSGPLAMEAQADRAPAHGPRRSRRSCRPAASPRCRLWRRAGGARLAY